MQRKEVLLYLYDVERFSEHLSHHAMKTCLRSCDLQIQPVTLIQYLFDCQSEAAVTVYDINHRYDIVFRKINSGLFRDRLDTTVDSDPEIIPPRLTFDLNRLG